MGSSPNEVSVKAHMELGKVIEYLEALISSLKEGTVYVEQDANVIALVPADSIDVEIEAAEKKGKQKFSMELGWRRNAQSSQDLSLKISSSRPEIAEATAPEETDGEAVEETNLED